MSRKPFVTGYAIVNGEFVLLARVGWTSAIRHETRRMVSPELGEQLATMVMGVNLETAIEFVNDYAL